MNSKWHLNSDSWANEANLPGFGQLLNSWLDVHRIFCVSAQPNFSWEWGHHEVTQVGFLASAAERMGGFSLIESWIYKNKASDEEKQYSGRNDLWLRLSPPETDKEPDTENDYLIEAKQKYLNVQLGPDKWGHEIDQMLNSARESCHPLRKKKEKVVAVAFLTMLYENENLKDHEKQSNDFITLVKNRGKTTNSTDAIGAIWMGTSDFQTAREERVNKYPGWKNNTFGVVIIANRVFFQ